jgi:hypothetical protein
VSRGRGRARPAHTGSSAEEIAPGLSSAALRARLHALGALRIKGFVETQEGLRIVQAVGSRIELTPAETPPARELVNRVVVIQRPA